MGWIITEPGLHRKQLRQLLRTTSGPVRIATAYLTETSLLADLAGRNVRLMTGLSALDVVTGATSLDALEAILDLGAECRTLSGEPRFHAKVYMIGSKHAVVSSANFTARALDSNVEVGIAVTGSDAEELADWFESVWVTADPIDRARISVLRRQTTDLRKRYQEFRRECSLIGLEGEHTKQEPASQRARTTRDPRFFVCNSNRKKLGLKGEKLMKSSRSALAWEYFDHMSDMESVKAGDIILLYGNGTGIIAVGKVLRQCEILALDDARRVSDAFDTREWRIPVEWMRWVSDNEACPWKGVLPPTFHNVSSDAWTERRNMVARHFFDGTWDAIEEG